VAHRSLHHALYFVAFIDRLNIGIASLTMNKGLGFSLAAAPAHSVNHPTAIAKPN
jgi:hypothetical protein